MEAVSSAFDHYPDGSSVAAGAGALWSRRGSTVRAVAGARPRPDARRPGDREAPGLERHVGSGMLSDRSAFEPIIGRSANFVAAVDEARKVAPTRTTVLLTGESGTGKEVLARAIHQGSACGGGPFIALNCAALPDTLVESELFGHERGAFTGADRLKRGRFELAAGGTLFLDEIGELTPAVQAKLLRVLQEREYERLGGTTTLQADFRLIAATNRDLQRAVAEGRFREDLYYRVAVFRIQLPTLRERGDDVLLLADHFMREIGGRIDVHEASLSDGARGCLARHAWPGNIRELRNAIERALILSKGARISPEHLGIETCSSGAPAVGAVSTPPADGPRSILTIAAQEKRVIVEALQRTHGHQARAARLLGLTRFQLYGRLKRYGIAVDHCLGADGV